MKEKEIEKLNKTEKDFLLRVLSKLIKTDFIPLEMWEVALLKEIIRKLK